MGVLDVLRGGKVSSMPAMVAAATRVIPGDRESVKAVKRQQDWQKDAWRYFDVLGELKYGANFVGDNLSRLKLYPAVRESPEAEPQPDDDATAQAAVSEQLGDHADLLRESGVNWTVAGEFYLVQEEDTQMEVRSTAEVEVKSGGDIYIRDDPSDTGGRKLSEDAFVARVHRKHPRFSQQADAPVRGVLSSCEEVLMIERMVRSILRSRIAGAGLLLMPNDISFGPVDPTRSQQDGEATEDPFLATLQDAMLTPIQDEGDAQAVVPLLVQADREQLDAIRRISLASDLDDGLAERLESALRRLAQGIELPPEIITGTADVNHWGAWQIERSTWKAHLEPKAQALVEAISRVWYLPYLREAGVNTDNRLLWYDPSGLITPTPSADDAKSAHDAFAISDETFRTRLGFDESDAPSKEEIEKRVRIAVARRANVSDLGQVDDVPLEGEQAPGGPPEQDTPEQPDAIVAAAVDDLGARLSRIDQTLADRLSASVDEAMRRVLEKAGARVRSKAQASTSASDAIDRVPNGRVSATLGKPAVERLGVDVNDLVEGEFGQFGRTFRRRVADAQDTVLNLLPDSIDADQLREGQEEDRQAAWIWLQQALTAAALGLLFSGRPDDVDGEFDPETVVDFSTVREALARAGGAGRVSRYAGRIRDVETALRARGVAAGVRVMNSLEAVGVSERAIMWDYRPELARRTFPPHSRLHGTTVESPEDEQLAAGGGWPPVAYYRPGDHAFCRCMFRPVLVEG